MKISKKAMLLVLISAVLVMFSACDKGPVCGNSVIEEGETSDTCCIDVGCVGEQTCVDNKCQEPVCGECQHIHEETHICIDYDCCDNSECSDDEECVDHECKGIVCGYCKYVEGHECKKLVCCDDDECDDGDDETIDLCKFPATKSAECTHESVDECEEDADCDDGDDSTKDSCSVGMPHECRNIPITECEGGDDFCPEDCNYRNDYDCEEEFIECEDDDLDCFTDAMDECLMAELTWTIVYDNDTAEIETETYMKIEDEEDDKCEVFFRIEDVKLKFTNDYKDDLEDDPYNYTEEEIDDLEDDAEDEANNVEGDYGTCYFEDYDEVVDILNDWEDGDYSIDDFDDYDCDGDYFD